jgi:hypothetical protein
VGGTSSCPANFTYIESICAGTAANGGDCYQIASSTCGPQGFSYDFDWPTLLDHLSKVTDENGKPERRLESILKSTTKQ